MNEEKLENQTDDQLTSAGLLCCALLNASQIIPGKNNPVSIGFALIDCEGRFVRVNDALAQINGVPAEEHSSKAVREIMGEAAEKIEAAITKVISTGRSVVNVEIAAVLPNRYETGFWLSSYFPFKFKKNEPYYVAAMVVETTGLLRVGKCFGSMMKHLPSAVDQLFLVGCPMPNSPEKVRAWNEAINSLRGCYDALCRISQYFPKPTESCEMATLFQTETLPQTILNFRETKKEEELTARELDVVKCLAEGKQTKEIAELLGVTINTVETYRYRIMQKLDIHTSSGIVAYAIKNKLLML